MEIEQLGTFWYRFPSSAVLLTLWTAFGFGLQAISAASKEDTLHELAAFRLSIDELRRAAQAGKVLEKLSETDPSLKTATQFAQRGGCWPSMRP